MARKRHTKGSAVRPGPAPRSRIYCWVFFFLLAGSQASLAKVTVYPIPAGVPVNDSYSVRIRPLGGEWQPLGIYQVEVRTGWATKTNSSMTYFDCDEPIEVEVTSPKKVNQVDLRPKRLHLTPKETGARTFRFILNEPHKISVEVNGDLYDNLHIFARPPERNPITAAREKVLYFGPGYHLLDQPLVLKSGQTVYLAGGAFVEIHANNKSLESHIFAEAQKEITIRGRGILYMPGLSFGEVYGPQGIRLLGCSHVKVEGITLLKQSRGWTHCIYDGSDVAYHDVALISVGRNGDGIDVVGGQRVEIDNCFVRASDDALCIKTWHRGQTLDGVVFQNSVVWNDITSHPIEIGFELRSPYVRNITYRNIDIIHSNGQNPPTDDFGTIDISHGDNATLSNVLFENIYIEKIHSPAIKLISCRIVYDPTWSRAAGDENRGQGKNITFRNIFYTGSAPSKIAGYNAEHGFEGITFENFYYNNKCVTTPAEANLTLGPFVEQVCFKTTDEPMTKPPSQ